PQETAQSLAQKLQSQFLNAPAVLLSFDLKSQGRIRVTADLRGGHIRLESPSLLIISDGKTVWNYDKSADRETIDNVTAGSEFHDPASLFRFADNYTAQIAASNRKTRYTLVLTPSQALQSLLKSAGEMQSLRLDLELHGSRVNILKASATSSRGTTQIKHLQIKTLRHVPSSEFIFTPKATTKVIDLRE
ncbi:MAG: outer membrane lipoprotein carrier protein LolA, partial [Candidatus Kapaibacterium sp.]